ncbi:MAG: LemA family protein [Clostridiales bacterium]|nr:LemA family protein [Clostridiales bacterium]
MKNPKVACVIMVAAIILSVIIGGHRSLSAEAAKVEDIFYNGVAGDGFGVNRELSYRVGLANNMVTVAKRYLPADDPDIKAVLDACSAIEKAKKTTDKVAANRKLQSACSDLYERLGKVDLNEKDSRYRENLMTDLNSSNDIISRDGYNQKAEQFNTELKRFPANIIGRITGIKAFALGR